jgi:hypothetical protein
MVLAAELDAKPAGGAEPADAARRQERLSFG